MDVRFDNKLAIVYVKDKCNNEELSDKFKKAVENLKYHTKILKPKVLYVPGLENTDEVKILEKVLEGLKSGLEAFAVIFQENIKFRKIYILVDDLVGSSDEEQEVREVLEERGFFVDDSGAESDKLKEDKLECVVLNNTTIFDIQRAVVGKSNIRKFVILKKYDKNNSFVKVEQTENENIAKDTKFFARVLAPEGVVKNEMGDNNNYTIVLDDKELAKCSPHVK
ncbi:MAG: hypothetical protein ACK4NF_00020 [Planctomycetota bacterium]